MTKIELNKYTNNNTLLRKIGTIIRNWTLDETDYNYNGNDKRKLYRKKGKKTIIDKYKNRNFTQMIPVICRYRTKK